MVCMLQVEPPCLFTGDHIFVGGCGESFIFVQAHQLVITHAQTLFVRVYGLIVNLHCFHSLQHATREGEGVGDFVTCDRQG